MGLKLKIIPEASNNLKIEESGGTITYNVLDFDSSVYIDFIWKDVSSHINYDKKVTFKLWLDNSVYSTTNNNICQLLGEDTTSSDKLDIRLDGSLIDVYADSGIGVVNRYAIGEDYNNQVLDIEVNKSFNNIDSFKINGVTQTPLDTISFFVSLFNWQIGYLLKNATVWDFKIYDTSSAGELIHYWKGYPDGNTDAAWADQQGTADGSILIENEATPTTRNIEGSGPVTGGSNLLIAQ